MKIAASILFDSAYLECALVSAYELAQRGDVLDALHLIFLSRGEEADAEAKATLLQFCVMVQGSVKIYPMEVKNELSDFQSHHFNNSIVYKALVPWLLPQHPFILNLDAGILLGRDFDDYLREVMDTLCHDDAKWVIAANCSQASEKLSSSQLKIRHHDKYPSGAVLLFNTRQYQAAQWDTRYVAAYEAWRKSLRYAEQELICLVSQDHELVELPRNGQLKVHALGHNVLHGLSERLPDTAADDGVYFKFMGSLKPWKYWNLDPDKAIYTRRRQRLETTFPLSGRVLVEAERRSCQNQEWIDNFLIAYDVYLILDGQPVDGLKGYA